MKLLVPSLFCCWALLVATGPASAVGHELWILDNRAGALDDVRSYDFGTDLYEALPSSNFLDPRAIAFGPDGKLWILDDDAGASDDVWSYDFGTNFYETLPSSNFADPRSFAFRTAQGRVPALHFPAVAILVGFLALWGLRSIRRP